jgi:hypothetical protein
MPRMGKTGPLGRGPETGRGMGACGQVTRAMGSDVGGPSRGVGKGEPAWGGGRGRCLGGGARQLSPDQQTGADPSDEAEALRKEIAALRGQLAAMESRLSDLGSPD